MKRLSGVMIAGMIVLGFVATSFAALGVTLETGNYPLYISGEENGTPAAIYATFIGLMQDTTYAYKVRLYEPGEHIYYGRTWNAETSKWVASSSEWASQPQFTATGSSQSMWVYIKNSSLNPSLVSGDRRLSINLRKLSGGDVSDNLDKAVTLLDMTSETGNGAWIECTTSSAPAGKPVIAYDSSGDAISTYGIKDDGTAPANYFKVAVPTTVTITKFEARNADNTVYATDTGSWQSSTPGAILTVTDVSLPVTLTSFTATVGDGEVILRWVTESEVATLGFNIYRAQGEERKDERGEPEDTEYVKINSELIPGAGTSTVRHSYSFIDRGVDNGTTYFYRLEDVSLDGKSTSHGPVKATLRATEQRKQKEELARQLRLEQNFPNPFNPKTTIRFAVPLLKDQPVVCLEIYSTTGQRVRTLIQSRIEPGLHQLVWNGRDQSGAQVASGVYLCVLKIGGELIEARKMVLIR